MKLEVSPNRWAETNNTISTVDQYNVIVPLNNIGKNWFQSFSNFSEIQFEGVPHGMNLPNSLLISEGISTLPRFQAPSAPGNYTISIVARNVELAVGFPSFFTF